MPSVEIVVAAGAGGRHNRLNNLRLCVEVSSNDTICRAQQESGGYIACRNRACGKRRIRYIRQNEIKQIVKRKYYKNYILRSDILKI